MATADLSPVQPEIAITSDDRRMLTTATVVVRRLSIVKKPGVGLRGPYGMSWRAN